jgi:hypothetical protein
MSKRTVSELQPGYFFQNRSLVRDIRTPGKNGFNL